MLALWEDPAEMSARWDTLMASYRAQKDGSQQPAPQPPQATTSSVSTQPLPRLLSDCVLTPMELASQSSSSSAESAEDAARNAAVMRSRAEAESARVAARAAARSEHRPLAELSLSPVGLRSLKWHSPLAGALSLSLSVASTAHTPMVRARLAG